MGITAYTYRVTFKKTGEYYYGLRYSSSMTLGDIWKTYFTSSKIIHELIIEHGVNSFDVDVRKTFDSVDSAMRWEAKVIRRIIKNEKCLNRGYFSFDSNNPVHNGMKGKLHSEETKKKAVETRRRNGSYENHKGLGHKHTEEQRRRMTDKWKGCVSSKKIYKFDREHLEKSYKENISKFVDEKSRNGKIRPSYTNFCIWYYDTYKPNCTFAGLRKATKEGIETEGLIRPTYSDINSVGISRL